MAKQKQVAASNDAQPAKGKTQKHPGLAIAGLLRRLKTVDIEAIGRRKAKLRAEMETLEQLESVAKKFRSAAGSEGISPWPAAQPGLTKGTERRMGDDDDSDESLGNRVSRLLRGGSSLSVGTIATALNATRVEVERTLREDVRFEEHKSNWRLMGNK